MDGCVIKSSLVFDYKTNKTVGKAGKYLTYVDSADRAE